MVERKLSNYALENNQRIQMKIDEPNQQAFGPLKLSLDVVTGKPLTYNMDNELKVVPVDRSQADYINVGGPNRLALANLIAQAPTLLAQRDELRAAARLLIEWYDADSGQSHKLVAGIDQARTALNNTKD